MSHCKPYPAYQDSGAQWIGLMPAHWRTSSLKWKAKRFAGGTPDKTNLIYWTDGVIPWLASGEVNQKFITKPTTYITEEAYKNSSAKWIPSGALVMALAGQGKTRGTIAQLAIDSTCNQSMAAIVPEAINARFLYWWLESSYSNLRGLSGDDVRDGLTLEILGQITCPLPTEAEQEAISRYLDRETARIDALITKKNRFIELLREKRQALITNAVTKGIDPNVKMKDSGVEWLGEVPEHWQVKKVKYVAQLESGHTPSKQVPEFWINCDIPWVSLSDSSQLREVDYIYDTAQYLNEKGIAGSSAHLLPTGTVVFTRDATVGLTAILGKEMAVSQHLIGWVPFSDIESEFLLRVFNAMASWLDSLTAGATIKTIGMDDIKKLTLALPPANEQKSIIVFIRKQREILDKTIAATQRSVELLRERRSALITAAVTGQIDLREAA